MARMNWQRVGQQQRLEPWDDYSARADREDNRIIEDRSRGRGTTAADLAQSGGPGKRARREALAYALGITTDQLKAVRSARSAATNSAPVKDLPKTQRAARTAREMGWSLADFEKLKQAERAVNSKRIPTRDPLSSGAKKALPKGPAAVAKAKKARKKQSELERFRASVPSRTFTSAGKRRPPVKKKTGARRRKHRPVP